MPTITQLVGYVCIAYSASLLVSLCSTRWKRSWVYLGIGADVLLFAAATTAEYFQ